MTDDLVWPARLETQRLVLRPFRLSDARLVARLAGDREIAANTLNIPHPYEEPAAVEWISLHGAWAAADEVYAFAIERTAEAGLIGAIALDVAREHDQSKLGYWIGRPFWNRGYATEAALAVVRFGFDRLGLHRIEANHFDHNKASGSVLLKAGFTYEGCLRGSVLKWGEYLDLHYYSILATDDPGPDAETRRSADAVTERL